MIKSGKQSKAIGGKEDINSSSTIPDIICSLTGLRMSPNSENSKESSKQDEKENSNADHPWMLGLDLDEQEDYLEFQRRKKFAEAYGAPKGQKTGGIFLYHDISFFFKSKL